MTNEPVRKKQYMKRALLISSLLLTAFVAWKQWPVAENSPASDEGYHTANATSRHGETSSSAPRERNAISPWHRAGQPAKVGEFIPDATITAGMHSHELKARRVVEQMVLRGEELDRLMPLLIHHAEQERRATRELLDQTPSPHHAEFIAALVGRATLRLTDSHLLNQLNEAQRQVLDASDAAQEYNLLHILANREFDKWKHSFDFGDSEQSVFEIFYHHWQERLELAFDGYQTSDQLKTQLVAHDNTMMEKLIKIFPADEIEKIRIIQEAAHDPLLQKLILTE